MSACIWYAEDDRAFRQSMTSILEDAGYRVRGFDSGDKLLTAMSAIPFRSMDLLLLDVRMPGKSGLDVLRDLRKAAPLPPTLLVSGEASITETVEALNLGVYDFLEKPFSHARLLKRIENCLRHHELQSEIKKLQQTDGPPLIGESAVMISLKDMLNRISPTESRVLIQGESGTGKELVANYLHDRGPRAKQPFVKINCAALPATLIEDELFGHVRGAFTGAQNDKPGLFEEAHRGTLLLDEIGDMEPALQTRLLRVLEDGKVRRIGSRNDRQVDVRVIAATNQDLKAKIADKSFREDLYFRLSTIPINVPPLRDRSGDIDLLTTFYFQRFSHLHRQRPKQITPAALEVMHGYAWPGNVRELRNICERLVILGGNPVRIDDLPSDLFETGPRQGQETGLIAHDRLNMTLKTFKAQCEREFIETALRRFDWDYVATAKSLDIQRTYLHRKINQLGIAKPGARSGDPEEDS